MPHSHHSHSGQFCRHATGKLQDVILEAIRQKFQVFGLTEHVPRFRAQDLYPEEGDLPLENLSKQFQAFLDESHRLKALHEPQIRLLVGLETEYISTTDLEQLQMLLSKEPSRIQYLVGSIHHVNQIPIDFDEATFHKSRSSLSSPSASDHETQEKFFSAYFDAQFELITRFHPEIIGHLDLCRLYTPDLCFQDYPQVWEQLERNVAEAVGYGALFEVNASAFRKGWDSAYPGEDVIQLIQKHSGRFALSDDSHGPHAVGLNYDRLYRYLQRVGVNEVWYLQESDVANAGGRHVRPVKSEGSWWEDSFWTDSERMGRSDDV